MGETLKMVNPKLHCRIKLPSSHVTTPPMKLFASLLFALSLAVPAFSSLAQEAKPAVTQAKVATEAVKSVQPDLAKGEASFAATCAACHGADGNSVIATQPKLAQQHPQYLVKQLQEFKSGKRSNPVMAAMASSLSAADMKNIAYWVTSRAAKPGFAKDKELVVLGEQIYRGGIAERQVPACAGCHSPNGAGIPAQYPRLSGQHADYAAAQLTGFRDGMRKNSLQMTQVTARMNDREIKAVADYLAGLR